MYSMYSDTLTMAEIMKPHIAHVVWIRISKSVWPWERRCNIDCEVFFFLHNQLKVQFIAIPALQAQNSHFMLSL